MVNGYELLLTGNTVAKRVGTVHIRAVPVIGNRSRDLDCSYRGTVKDICTVYNVAGTVHGIRHCLERWHCSQKPVTVMATVLCEGEAGI
jgi:hypothetical protein